MPKHRGSFNDFKLSDGEVEDNDDEDADKGKQRELLFLGGVGGGGGGPIKRSTLCNT